MVGNFHREIARIRLRQGIFADDCPKLSTFKGIYLGCLPTLAGLGRGSPLALAKSNTPPEWPWDALCAIPKQLLVRISWWGWNRRHGPNGRLNVKICMRPTEIA